MRVLSVLAAFGLMMLAQPAFAQVNAEAIFQQRCKGCHEPPIDRAISRAEMRQREADAMVQILTRGVMAPMAQGLTRQEINALAFHLTGRPPGQAARGPQPGAQPSDPICKAHPPVQASASDWNGFGRDPQATRHQPNPGGLTAANVARLKPKWSFSLSGGKYGQPTVIGRHLFVASYGGHAFSLDADTGCVHWRADLGSASRTSPVLGQVGGRWVVFVGDSNSDVHALDANTGKRLWTTNVETHERSRLTGSPALHEGVLYVPTSSAEETITSVATYECCTFSGSVIAIDAKTGKIRWKRKLLPDAKPTRKNAAGTQMYGPAGAAIWSQPAIDPKRRHVYVATGDSYTEVKESMSDAVVALDLGTGRVVWANQVTEDDNFLVGCGAQRGINCPLGDIGPDYDYGASPIPVTAGGKALVLSGQKSGIVYAMDAATGKLVWQTKVGAGSAIGGIEWGMAYDGRLLFAANSDAGARKDPKPGLYALNPATGKVVWSAPAPTPTCSFKAPRCSNAYAAPPSAMPGVVFTGTHDGWLRAYDSRTGKKLWEDDTAGRKYVTVQGVKDQPGGSVDATGPVLAGGRLFVLSGYSGSSGGFGNPLNVLIAYSVDGR
ncbi:PQQ-binding-like beta-propeller repeat protein [Phenylobacterium sp.]|uniref:outer membrane protein assembly factor BamB family protein n=1 Tax=Phenylobacterium sp. TaxID=1871053 RepID=UPI002F94CF23